MEANERGRVASHSLMSPPQRAKRAETRSLTSGVSSSRSRRRASSSAGVGGAADSTGLKMDRATCEEMVRDTGFEPVTPSVSGRCSTTELTAHEITLLGARGT